MKMRTEQMQERKLKVLKTFWIAAFFASPLIPLTLYFHGNWYTFFHAWSLGMSAGIVAFCFLMNQFLLGSRPRYFDRLFGLDRILGFHSKMGTVSALLIILHVLLKNIYSYNKNLQVAFGVTAAAIFIVIIVVSILFFSLTSLARLRPVEALRNFSAGTLRLQYQHLRAFHNLTVAAAALAAAHVVLASSTAEQPVRQAVMGLWFLAAMGFYAEHKFIRNSRARRAPFTVTSVTRSGKDVWTVSMKPPEGKELKNKAGQFAYFAFIEGRPGKEEHPFTLSSPEGAEEVSFTAKKLGDWTSGIESVKPGDPVAVNGPYGLFTINRIPGERVLAFLAGGIGITPFLSMLRTLAEKKEGRNIELVWNVSHSQDLFCRDELESFTEKIPGFKWKALVSRDDEWKGEKGRLEPSVLASMDFPADTDYFVCGPVKQMEAVISHLRERGVRPAQIRFEKFSM